MSDVTRCAAPGSAKIMKKNSDAQKRRRTLRLFIVLTPGKFLHSPSIPNLGKLAMRGVRRIALLDRGMRIAHPKARLDFGSACRILKRFTALQTEKCGKILSINPPTLTSMTLSSFFAGRQEDKSIS